MRLATGFVFALATAALASTCAAQSLGEVARQQRAKKKPADVQRRVITEEQLPPSTTKEADSAPSTKAVKPEDAKESSNESATAKDEKQNAAELQARIKVQKQKVHELEAKIQAAQKRLDERNAVGTVTVDRLVIIQPGGWQSAGACDLSAASYSDPYKAWCQEPMKLEAELEENQGKLATERAALEALQEQARRQGYGSAFYDPD